jgi:hypothetical protein
MPSIAPLCGRLGRLFAFFPLGERDDAFALVAHVDQRELAVDAQDFTIDDFVDGQLAAAPIDVGGKSAAHRLAEFFFPLFLIKVQSSNQISVNHYLCLASFECLKCGSLAVQLRLEIPPSRSGLP